MHSFKAGIPQHISLTNSDVYYHSQSPLYLRGDDRGRNGSRLSDLGELEQSAGNGLHHIEDFNLSRSAIYNGIKANNVPIVSNNLLFSGLTNSVCSSEIGGIVGFGGTGHLENWGDSGVVADHSQQTETSTDTDDKNQYPRRVHDERLIVADSADEFKGKIGDQKIALCRLAQNREAARKCRMRKKAYVQQLESSRQRLTWLEQDLKGARRQGILVASGFSGDQNHSISGNGPVAFDLDYARWLDEHQRLIDDIRSAVNSHVSDNELQLVVEGVMFHYDEIFRFKSSFAKSDIFHILSGMWKTPAERCFMWLGGFRSSEVLKILRNQIEPLTKQQLVGISNLQQSSQQAEDALSQGMEALQQSLMETLASNSHNLGNVADYMGQMAIAMSKLATLENFLHQADLLRLQTLQQLQRILTTRQVARALLAINDYNAKLRALSSLWLARPKKLS